MIRKYHNNTQQTNPRHRKEELQNIYSTKTFVKKKQQALSSSYYSY